MNTLPDITTDDLSAFAGRGPAFVTFGETMIRENPADQQRPEQMRLAHLALAGSEFSIATLVARLGLPTAYIMRLPDNPYGWMLRDAARGQGIDTSYLVWAPRAELMGRYLYEPGRSPRPGVVWYQRMHSAASRLDAGMVDWAAALRDARLLHASGISFGLAAHSGYAGNPLLAAFREALAAKPADCWVGMDFNYRSTLWSEAECQRVMTPLLEDAADILIASPYDLAKHYGLGCGRWSAAQVLAGEADDFHDDDLRAFGEAVTQRFGLQAVAVTLRREQSSEEHRWESAVMSREGGFARSGALRSFLVQDRIGGGDAWAGGFYYGLLTAGLNPAGLAKGVLVGDAAARLKQTLMFDLPILHKVELAALIKADHNGAGRGTVR